MKRTGRLRRWAALLAIGLGPLVAGPTPAPAETASQWVEGLGSRARLVAGGAAETTGELLAGIEIRLDKGWKTYWRAPGDAGIPPSFDWAGSGNLASAEVLYPVPHRLSDPSGDTIGYKGSVIFPVRLRAQDPGAPVQLRLKLDYAACSDLCVPARAELTLSLPAGAGAQGEAGAAVRESLAHVPAAAGHGPGLPQVRSVEIGETNGKRGLIVTVVQPREAQSPDLFVEGPERWYLPPAVRLSEREGPEGLELTYGVSLASVGKSATLSGAALRFTIVSETGAVEQEWTLR